MSSPNRSYGKRLRGWWSHPYRWWRLRNLTTDRLVCAIKGHEWVTSTIADFCSRCMREPGEVRTLRDYFAAQASWREPYQNPAESKGNSAK